MLLSQSLAITNPVNYEISEEQDPGTFIGNIKFDAVLADEYTDVQLATLSYHLIPNHNDHYFYLDSHTGEFLTQDILDRDHRDVCRSDAECVIQLQTAVRGTGGIFKLIKIHINIWI